MVNEVKNVKLRSSIEGLAAVFGRTFSVTIIEEIFFQLLFARKFAVLLHLYVLIQSKQNNTCLYIAI